uniref:Uncharacterized protein n=1 Tax=Anguilla anguilla TaxID=7936 RepID=A0A0E9UFZ3_ANGAN
MGAEYFGRNCITVQVYGSVKFQICCCLFYEILMYVCVCVCVLYKFKPI